MDVINQIIDKIMEFITNLLKNSGMWESLSEFAEKMFG